MKRIVNGTMLIIFTLMMIMCCTSIKTDASEMNHIEDKTSFDIAADKTGVRMKGTLYAEDNIIHVSKTDINTELGERTPEWLIKLDNRETERLESDIEAAKWDTIEARFLVIKINKLISENRL